MAVSVADIKSPVAQELNIFNKKFKASMRTKVPLLDKITYFLVQRKGKQMRPLFVLLTAKMLGNINEKTYIGASLIELMHTASLVHDDVVDDAYRRRGFFSINALWKNKVAVLVGDFLLSRSLLLAIENKEFGQLENLSSAVKAMSEGELLQIEKARKLDITEEVYFEIIKAKTASLIRSACRAGAMSVTEDESTIEEIGQIGENIGIAFQIKDDLFDYGDADVGKPRGIDIKEQKMTLPLIYTLQNVDKATKRFIIKTVKHHNTNKPRVNQVIKHVKDAGGIRYAEQVMRAYQQKALTALDQYPDNEAKQALIQLVNYTIERKK
ncbi:MAG: polyprenyl synthetase family protein [Saprospiraceae bacterium]|nr:polyprenyl synthetase family protein [Saprospiraceae bacterium]